MRGDDKQACDDGFSLVEVLAVLGIAAAIVAVMIAAKPGTPRQIGLDATARQVAAGLRQTRTAAIRENAEAIVVIDVARREVRFPKGNSIALLPAGVDTTVITAKHTKEANEGMIVFFPDGSSSGGRISLSFLDRTEEIVVDWLTGHAAVTTKSQAK